MTTVADFASVLDARTVELLEQRANVRPGFHRRGWLVRRALLAADVLGLSIAFGAAELLYGRSPNDGAVTQAGEFAVFAFSLPLWVVAAKFYRLYDRDEERADHSTADDFAGVFHLITLCTFILYAVSKASRHFNPEFWKLLMFWLFAIGAVATLRVVARAYCRTRVEYLQNTIIVGAGEVGQNVARKLLKHPEYGLNLIGFIDANPRAPIPGLEYLTLLGTVGDIPELIDLLDVERVIVAFSNEPHEDTLELIRRLNALDVQVDIVPRFFDVLSGNVELHTVEGLPLCALPRMRLSRSSKALKRLVDVAGATIGIVVLAPLFAVVAIAIKVDSNGPVFFRQVRMGEGRRPFRIWKFRSMSLDADERKAEYAHLNKHLEPGGDPRMFKINDDPRVTRVGAFLRRTSIDELPQLFNVLVGQMSLVGPRPLIPDEDQHVHAWACRRLDLRPGVTGLWQVLGRDAIAFDEMVRLDYRYVTSWSLWNDIRLLAQTLPALLRGRRGLRKGTSADSLSEAVRGGAP